MHAAPVSRFTRLQESLADTSNEWRDFTQYRPQTKIFICAGARKSEKAPAPASIRAQPGSKLAATKSCPRSIKQGGLFMMERTLTIACYYLTSHDF
jgi:hypothetical protein